MVPNDYTEQRVEVASFLRSSIYDVDRWIAPAHLSKLHELIHPTSTDLEAAIARSNGGFALSNAKDTNPSRNKCRNDRIGSDGQAFCKI